MTPMPPSTHAPSPTSHVRWWICFLIFLATALIYSDRQFLSLLKSTLATEIHWTDSQFAMVNTFFLGAYAFGLLFVGRLVDKVGVRTGYALTVLFWALAAFSHTLVASVGGFVAARIFLGLSESGNFPTAVKAVAQWFPDTERAFATTIVNCGANVGAVFAPLLVAWLLGFSTWHAPFVLAGVAGLAWVVVWWLFYRTPSEHRLVSPSELSWINSGASASQESTQPVPWSRVAAIPQTWSFIVAKFLTDPVWFFLLFWLPDYFKRTRHLDIKSSWPHLMTIYALVTALSLLGGYFPGYLVRRGWSITRARKTALLTYAVMVLPVIFVGKAGDWTAVILIGLVGAAHQAWSANLFTTVSDMFPRRTIATIIGMGSMAGAVGSMIFQYLCGHILEAFGPSGAGTGYLLLFAYAASAYLVAFFLNNLLAPNYQPVAIGDEA
jgi:ACS family hexuronate transporter-like MFS transporter